MLNDLIRALPHRSLHLVIGSYLWQRSSASRLEEVFVLVRFETDRQLSVLVENRALDHGRLRQHQCPCLGGIDVLAFFFGQFAKRRSGPVKQLFPWDTFQKAVERFAVETIFLVIVKSVVDTMIF